MQNKQKIENNAKFDEFKTQYGNKEDAKEAMEKYFYERFAKIMTKAKFKVSESDKNKFYGFSYNGKHLILTINPISEKITMYAEIESNNQKESDNKEIDLELVSSKPLKYSQNDDEGALKEKINKYLIKNVGLKISFLGEGQQPKDVEGSSDSNKGQQPKDAEGSSDSNKGQQPKDAEGSSDSNKGQQPKKKIK